MRKILFVFLLGTIFTFVSCNQHEDGNYVPPITHFEKIKGNWQVTKASQLDQFAIQLKNSPVTELDLTKAWDFKSMKLNFVVDEENAPTNFKLTLSEEVPNLLGGLEGTWTLDYPFTEVGKKRFIFLSPSDKDGKTTLELVKIPSKPTDPLAFQLNRSDDGKLIISYYFELTRIVEAQE